LVLGCVGLIDVKGIDVAQPTLESVIDVGQGISVGPGRFGKKNKRRALNKRRAWKIWKKE
jgi:hypothetical protein